MDIGLVIAMYLNSRAITVAMDIVIYLDSTYPLFGHFTPYFDQFTFEFGHFMKHIGHSAKITIILDSADPLFGHSTTYFVQFTFRFWTLYETYWTLG